MSNLNIIKSIYDKLPYKFKVIISWFFFRFYPHQLKPVNNISLINHERYTRNALLSYITAPFRLTSIDPQIFSFSNIGIASSIVRVLNQLGYLVDVVEYTDTDFVPKKNYDLFIGHGGFNFQNIANRLSLNCRKIYFSAGHYWKYWNRKEKERIDNLNRRKKSDYPYERLDISEESALNHSEAIIALGNEIVAKSYSKFSRVYTLNNGVYYDDHFDKTIKDFSQARNNFLFFAGGGNVHKGLDLLIEAFSEMSSHLFICQLISPAFYNLYKYELEKTPNIHLIGWIKPRTPSYYEIVDKCAYLIYPSCADGSPGAVIESMLQGLIPIVSKETTIDTDDFGYTLKNNSIKEIKKALSVFKNKSEKWYRQASHKTRNISLTKYSEKEFKNNFTKIINHIISVS